MGSIATQQLSLLQSTGEEKIKYTTFTYQGIRTGSFTSNILKTAPTSMKPINANLSVEYLRPVKAVKHTTELYSVNIINKNPTFRYKNFDWTLGANNSIRLSGIYDPEPVSGNYLVASPQTEMPIGTAKGNPIIKTKLNTTELAPGNSIEYGFYYYFAKFDATGPLSDTYTFLTTVGIDTTGNNIVNKMYSYTDNKFKEECASCGEGGAAISFTDDEFFASTTTSSLNQWSKFTKTINTPLISNDYKIEVSIYPPKRESTDINYPIGSNYYDSFYVGTKNTLGNDFVEKKNIGFSALGVVTFPLGKATGVYNRDKVLNTNNLADSEFIGRFEGSFSRKSFNETKTLDKIVNQEIANDFRKSVKRYEGDFYKKDGDPAPLNLFNKIWVNFGSSISQDSASSMIDSMEYRVKSNTYSLVMHIPNQDDDTSTYDEYYYD